MILLIMSLIFNLYQYGTIQKYKNKISSIDMEFKGLINFLSRNIEDFDKNNDVSLRYLSSIAGSIFWLSQASSIYKNQISLSGTDVFAEINNLFINITPDKINRIKKHDIQFSQQLKKLSDDPSNEEAQQQLLKIIKEINNK